MDSPEIGFHGQSASETALSADLREVPLTHEEVREGIPSEQIISRPNKATSSRFGRSRSLLPDRLLMNSYIPPYGQAPPMEEVSAPGPRRCLGDYHSLEAIQRGRIPRNPFGTTISGTTLNAGSCASGGER